MEPTAINKIKPTQREVELSTLPLIDTMRDALPFSPFLPESGTIEDPN